MQHYLHCSCWCLEIAVNVAYVISVNVAYVLLCIAQVIACLPLMVCDVGIVYFCGCVMNLPMCLLLLYLLLCDTHRAQYEDDEEIVNEAVNSAKNLKQLAANISTAWDEDRLESKVNACMTISPACNAQSQGECLGHNQCCIQIVH
jgi:hypothetical protein